jgi:hypothetical protein
VRTKIEFGVGQRCVFLEKSLMISIAELILIEFSVSVYASKKDREEWMTMIYGIQSLSVLGWTNIQKLS